jgi:hypothetical protein
MVKVDSKSIQKGLDMMIGATGESKADLKRMR